MNTNYKDFQYFDFHDSYFEKIEIDGNKLICYLNSVNLSHLCLHNPYHCPMMLSLLKVEFIDYEIENKNFPFHKLYEEAYEILDVEKVKQINETYIYVVSLVSRTDFIQLKIKFCDILFEWEGFETKAWYVYKKGVINDIEKGAD